MITELCGLKVNSKIKAPIPFDGEATILGFRYYTSRNTGRTYMVGDYLTDDGKMAFDSIEKLVKHKHEEADTNARLIASAPDMLAALKELSQYIETMKWGQAWPGRPHAIADKARSAIAKAEGQ